jgi:hypothetical protein
MIKTANNNKNYRHDVVDRVVKEAKNIYLGLDLNAI